MGVLTIYMVVALATGICSVYEFVWPLIRLAQARNITNEFTNNVLVTLFVTLLINTVTAPYWMLVLLFPSLSTAATIGLSTVFLAQSENHT